MHHSIIIYFSHNQRNNFVQIKKNCDLEKSTIHLINTLTYKYNLVVHDKYWVVAGNLVLNGARIHFRNKSIQIWWLRHDSYVSAIDKWFLISTTDGASSVATITPGVSFKKRVTGTSFHSQFWINLFVILILPVLYHCIRAVSNRKKKFKNLLCKNIDKMLIFVPIVERSCYMWHHLVTEVLDSNALPNSMEGSIWSSHQSMSANFGSDILGSLVQRRNFSDTDGIQNSLCD